MGITAKFRFANADRDGFASGEPVRILGDTFRHVYMAVGVESRVERDGNRLIGGDSRAVIQTWNGRHRHAWMEDIVPAHAEWSTADSLRVANRNTNRAARARLQVEKIARAADRRQAAIEHRTRSLSAFVKFLRGMKPWQVENRAAYISRQKNIPDGWLMALVAAAPGV
jgi:hypothetical protein